MTATRTVADPWVIVQAAGAEICDMPHCNPKSGSLGVSVRLMTTSGSADKIRTMLAEANGRLRKASAEYFDLLEKGLGSSPLPVAGQAKEFCDYMQRNVTATFDLGDNLIQAKDMQDAVKIQSDFFQDQMRSLTDHARSMGESAMKAATGVFTPES